MREIEYLNLDTTGMFIFGEIKADLVLVEILSIYCITCQMQASCDETGCDARNG